MGTYGSVIAFAPVSIPPKEALLQQTCAELLQIFEDHGVVPPGAMESAAYFLDPFESNILVPFFEDENEPENFEFCIGRHTAPLTPKIEELVYAYPLKTSGFWLAHFKKTRYDYIDLRSIGDMNQQYQFPRVNVYAFNRQLMITDSVLGELVANTWSIVEFQLDCRFDDRTHIIPFPNHPVFQGLKQYWGGFEWAAVC